MIRVSLAYIKVYLYYIGKPRDSRANQMAEEYVRRTTRYLHCEMREIPPGPFSTRGSAIPRA